MEGSKFREFKQKTDFLKVINEIKVLVGKSNFIR